MLQKLSLCLDQITDFDKDYLNILIPSEIALHILNKNNKNQLAVTVTYVFSGFCYLDFLIKHEQNNMSKIIVLFQFDTIFFLSKKIDFNRIK